MLIKVDPEPRGRVALVLSGGVALGAYQVGAYEALRDAGGMEPGWVAGVSIGAVNAAIIAGNAPERRAERLQQFWEGAAEILPLLAPWASPPSHGVLREGYNLASALQTLAFGRPGVFQRRLIPSADERPGLYDLGPLARRLEEVVDFARLNGGETRLSIAATDVVSGERVVFDTARGTRLGAEHVLASCALMPVFAPVEVEGRLLGDGGLSGNAPVDAVLGDEPGDSGDLLCFVVDLFARAGSRPRSLAAAANRSVDLVFGNQTWLVLEAHRRERALRGEAAGRATVLLMAYRAALDEAGIAKQFDYSQATLAERRRAGDAHMRAALGALDGLPADGAAGLAVHDIPPP